MIPKAKIKVMTIVGTRPEIIRLSRTIALFEKHVNDWHNCLSLERSVSGRGGNKLRTYRLFKNSNLICLGVNSFRKSVKGHLGAH